MKSLSCSWLLGFVGGALVMTGCSEANDDATGPYPTTYDAGHDAAASDVAVGATTTTHEAGSAKQDATASSAADASSAPSGDASGNPGALVINEISGKDPDYVELFNAGSASVDLGGIGVTEAKHDDAGVPGTPKTAAVFPAGAQLAPGAYALALGAPQDGGTVLSPCPASICVQATWNISNTHGSTVSVLDSAGTAVAQEALPADTTGTGQSWGRLPNGTGAFAINAQTPGKANAGP